MALFQIKNMYSYLKKPQKYLSENKTITARSGWEISFICDFLDKHSSVLGWSSESIIIPYKCPVRGGSIHRYFPDFWMMVLEANQTKKEYIVEIKPSSECYPPKTPKKITKNYKTACETFLKNQAKWDATKVYCASQRKLGRNIEFVVMTEKGIHYEDGRFEKIVFFKV
jgi:hypothetical protein